MNLIFLGPPGAGKGTQADVVCADRAIPKISTGDILRQARKDQTELGKKAESFMVAGKLVPDEVVIGIVTERLAQPDCNSGYVLDGFPRTEPQANALSKILDKSGKQISAVVNLEVPDSYIIERLSGRRICQACGASFHLKFAPSTKVDACDKCGGKLIQRKDDLKETIIERLNVYKDQTQPLINYYFKTGLLRTIDGTGSQLDVTGRILKIISDLK